MSKDTGGLILRNWPASPDTQITGEVLYSNFFIALRSSAQSQDRTIYFKSTSLHQYYCQAVPSNGHWARSARQNKEAGVPEGWQRRSLRRLRRRRSTAGGKGHGLRRAGLGRQGEKQRGPGRAGRSLRERRVGRAARSSLPRFSHGSPLPIATVPHPTRSALSKNHSPEAESEWPGNRKENGDGRHSLLGGVRRSRQSPQAHPNPFLFRLPR